jgi:hypothetical protein
VNDLPSLRAPKPDRPARKRRRLSPLVVDARRLARDYLAAVDRAFLASDRAKQLGTALLQELTRKKWNRREPTTK